jgi:hypothetical protein
MSAAPHNAQLDRRSHRDRSSEVWDGLTRGKRRAGEWSSKHSRSISVVGTEWDDGASSIEQYSHEGTAWDGGGGAHAGVFDETRAAAQSSGFRWQSGRRRFAAEGRQGTQPSMQLQLQKAAWRNG